MSAGARQIELFAAPESGGPPPAAGPVPLSLSFTLDLAAGKFRISWQPSDVPALVACGEIEPLRQPQFIYFALDWRIDVAGQARPEHGRITSHHSSIAAVVRRVRNQFPVADDAVRARVVPPADWGPFEVGNESPLRLIPGGDPWKWMQLQVGNLARAVEAVRHACGRDADLLRQRAALAFARAHLPGGPASACPFRLRITSDLMRQSIGFEWTDSASGTRAAGGRVRRTGPDRLTWELDVQGRREEKVTSARGDDIRQQRLAWTERFPTLPEAVTAWVRRASLGSIRPLNVEHPPFGPDECPWLWLESIIVGMVHAARSGLGSPGEFPPCVPTFLAHPLDRMDRRLDRREEKRLEEERRREEAKHRLLEERHRREQRAAERAQARTEKPGATAKSAPPAPAARARAPLPPVPVRMDLPAMEFQDTAFPLTDLRDYFLRERAALWWVSNQSDDLLALPHCRIERLEYQVRTALRVLGPLRGRALLSDEVGLGKTIEAGLVLKELLTRGMVKRFLVLTVPSLVDQWEEELSDKFGLETVTTNHAAARADVEKFWREPAGLVASLHTLKQPAHLEIARTVNWDLLVVDEAHYLRNRESQAWQAVNALPRQFLLLLTATPVQNSLEELYNLVTLLQPGQLPTPKEFRARFIDPARPRQPREPEELRRLLGQVMIRNTRANAGLNLPPRRAETVAFEPSEAERGFWEEWEKEFRAELAQLPTSQASLWGRLLLQAAGSSPAAWTGALEKFPRREAALRWGQRAMLDASWRRKCELIVPLTRGEGGVVIFTQFLDTQAALASALRAAGVGTFLVNGATPAAQRQPITEEFRQRGGALILTHSGTEGRNLQFCHQLVNFDLPWNPMEIEQRIGRLHRLGQRHPVRIYNLVQAGTLQEHLLAVLQEKLNLFELVVGETGLILGERFTSDEFAEEVLRRWREGEGRVAETLASLGEELAAARAAYGEIKQLDATLFAKDYESI